MRSGGEDLHHAAGLACVCVVPLVCSPLDRRLEPPTRMMMDCRPCAEGPASKGDGQMSEESPEVGLGCNSEANLDEGQFPVMPTRPPTVPCQLGGG